MSQKTQRGRRQRTAGGPQAHPTEGLQGAAMGCYRGAMGWLVFGLKFGLNSAKPQAGRGGRRA